MTNQLIASAIAYNNYRDIDDRDDLIRYLRSELMLDDEHNPTDADLIDAIDRDIRDALHNTNIDFFIPAAMLNNISDDDFDAASDFILDNFDAAIILRMILDNRL